MYYCPHCKVKFTVVCTELEFVNIKIRACPYCKHEGVAMAWWLSPDPVKKYADERESEIRSLMMEVVENGPLVQEPKSRQMRRKPKE